MKHHNLHVHMPVLCLWISANGTTLPIPRRPSPVTAATAITCNGGQSIPPLHQAPALSLLAALSPDGCGPCPSSGAVRCAEQLGPRLARGPPETRQRFLDARSHRHGLPQSPSISLNLPPAQGSPIQRVTERPPPTPQPSCAGFCRKPEGVVRAGGVAWLTSGRMHTEFV